MHRFNRREAIKTTAVGAGIGLGTGAGTAGALLADDGPVEPAAEISFTATATGGYVTLGADSPTDSEAFLGPIELGQDIDLPVEIQGTAYDDGTWESTAIQIPDITDHFADIDFQAIIQDFIDGFSVVDLVNDLELEEIISFVVEVVDNLNLTQEEATTLADTIGNLLANFGFSGLESFIETFLLDPQEQTIWTILGLLEIQSIQDILDLAGIQDLSELDVILQDFFDNLDLEALLGSGDLQTFFDSASLDVAPMPVTGQFEPQNRHVTVPFQDADVAVAFQDKEYITGQVGLTGNLTTGTSGDLAGSGVDFITQTPEVTFVDNEFVLGLDQVDLENADIATIVAELFDALNLELGSITPEDVEQILDDFDLAGILEGVDLQRYVDQIITDEPGRHYMELEFEMDFTEIPLLPGTVSGTITRDDGTVFDGASITLLDPDTGEIGESTTPENGAYSIEFHPGTYVVVFDAPEKGQVREQITVGEDESVTIDKQLTEGPPPLPGHDNAPQDLDDDDIYEAVRGEGQLSINDVQSLFAHLDDPEVQGNAHYYNFHGSNPDQVNIFDVQALFVRLQES